MQGGGGEWGREGGRWRGGREVERREGGGRRKGRERRAGGREREEREKERAVFTDSIGLASFLHVEAKATISLTHAHNYVYCKDRYYNTTVVKP